MEEDRNNIYIYKIYLDSGQTCLSCIRNLSWKFSGGECVSLAGENIEYEEYFALKRLYNGLEYGRTDTVEASAIKLISVVDYIDAERLKKIMLAHKV